MRTIDKIDRLETLINRLLNSGFCGEDVKVALDELAACETSEENEYHQLALIAYVGTALRKATVELLMLRTQVRKLKEELERR